MLISTDCVWNTINSEKLERVMKQDNRNNLTITSDSKDYSQLKSDYLLGGTASIWNGPIVN